jgi:hypothetical protein
LRFTAELNGWECLCIYLFLDVSMPYAGIA